MSKGIGTFPKAPPSKLWLTLPEACVELGLSYNTVNKMLITGELKGVKRKGAWRIPRSEALRYLAQQQAEELGVLGGVS